MKEPAIYKKLKGSPLAKRIASGAFWSLTGTALAKFIVLLSGIACARILGKEEYGEFGMVRSTINLFVVFGTAGLGMTATKYISQFRIKHPEKINNIYLITNGFAYITGLIVTTIILLSSTYLATQTLGAPQLVPSIRFGAILLFVTVANGAQNGTLAGMENFRAIAINTLYGSIAESILMLLGGYLYGVAGAIVGFGCGFIVLYICNWNSIRKCFRKNNINIKFNSITKDDLRILYKFTLPAALSSFMVMPVYWIMRTILVKHDGFGELAIFEAADQWKVIILFIPSAVSNIVLPILSSMSENNTSNQFWKVLYTNMIINAGIAALLSLLVIVLSPYIMKSYGNEYNEPLPLIILALSTIPSSVASVIGSSIASRQKMWTGYLFNTLWATMMICFTITFIKYDYGATALAFATLFSYLIHSIIQFIYLKRCVSNSKTITKISNYVQK